MRKIPSLPVSDMAPDNPLSLIILGNKHLKSLAVIDYSPSTIEGRRFDLAWFIRWCYQRAVACVTEISGDVLERYVGHLYRYSSKKTGRALSIYSIARRISAVRIFFSWLTKNNYVLYNPAGVLSYPKLPRFLPRNVLSIEEAEIIMSQPDIDTDIGMRDRAIMELMYSSGIRRREIVELTQKCVDLERGILIVLEGKGKKDRYVPVSERACCWVEKYIRQARPNLCAPPDRGKLFLTKYGKPFANPGGLSCMVRRYINQTGIAKSGACHIFRHTMATLMLENGADIRYIQEILGHSWISSTQIYTKVSIGKLKQVHALTHPANFDEQEDECEK